MVLAPHNWRREFRIPSQNNIGAIGCGPALQCRWIGGDYQTKNDAIVVGAPETLVCANSIGANCHRPFGLIPLKAPTRPRSFRCHNPAV